MSPEERATALQMLGGKAGGIRHMQLANQEREAMGGAPPPPQTPMGGPALQPSPVGGPAQPPVDFFTGKRPDPMKDPAKLKKLAELLRGAAR